MNDIFRLRKTAYSLKNPHLFESQNPKTNRYDLYCIAYIVSQIWKTFSIAKRLNFSKNFQTYQQKISLTESAFQSHVTLMISFMIAVHCFQFQERTLTCFHHGDY